MVLPTTPFAKALVRWATGRRLTDRLPELRVITKITAPRARKINASQAIPNTQEKQNAYLVHFYTRKHAARQENQDPQ